MIAHPHQRSDGTWVVVVEMTTAEAFAVPWPVGDWRAIDVAVLDAHERNRAAS